MPVYGDPSEITRRRIAAALIDIVALVLLLIVVGLLFGRAHAHGGSASVSLRGTSALVWVVLALAYHFIPEALTGQTLGKRMLGLRVQSVGGGAPSTLGVAVRTVLRIVDVLPVFYLLGFIVIVVSGNRAQRLGDLAAGTAVRRA